MTFTETPASSLSLGDLVRMGDSADAVVALRRNRRRNVVVTLAHFGEWEVSSTFPVTTVAR